MTPMPPKYQPFCPEMPYDEYRAADAIAKSDLDLVNNAPALLEWKKNSPVDERVDNAGDFGSAFHTFILEPGKFDSEFAVEPEKIDRRTKAGKAALAEFEKEAEGKSILSRDDFTTISLMRKSVMAHPVASEIITTADYFESSIFYDDILPCKARPDIICKQHHLIADLKSIKKIDKWLWRDILDYRYHVQAVHYSKAYESAFGVKPRFLFIFVSKERSLGQYPVRVMELDNEFLALAEDDRRRNLLDLKKCQESGIYRGIEKLFMGGHA